MDFDIIKILKTLIFKVIVLMSLTLMIITYSLLNLNLNTNTNIQNEGNATEDMLISQKVFIDNLIKQEEEIKTKAILDKYKELMSLILVIAKQGNFYHKKDILKELIKTFMKNDGVIALKIINEDNKTLIASQNTNNIAIFIKEIPQNIIANKALTFIKMPMPMPKDKNEGFMVVYLNLEALKQNIYDTSDTYLKGFSIFKNTLDTKEKEPTSLKAKYLIYSALIILFVIGVIFYLIVNRPLSKLKAGIENFFLVFNNKIKTIERIKISTKDEFEDIANFINKNIESSLKLYEYTQKTNQEMLLSNSRMTHSIDYLSIIKNTFIPEKRIMDDIFKDYFIHSIPRNIIGGDIYFFNKINDDEFLLMCIDCSKQNISGAVDNILVKIIHHHIVDNLKNSNSDISPSKILTEFNKKLKTILNQYDKKSKSNIGFNGGVVHINKKTKKIRYSGAYMDLYYIKNQSANIMPANKYSVGYKDCDMDYDYKESEFEADNLKLYLSTDGFFNQLGGDKNYRFGKKRFKAMLEANHEKSFKEQKDIYIKTIQDYQGSYENVDDITFIGFNAF